jgi:hypothetical protein
MTWLISICFAIAAVICAFFRPVWAWCAIAPPELFLVWMAFTLFRRTYRPFPLLSPDAKALFQQYPHFYSMPFACGDFGSAAVYLQFTGLALLIIGLFKAFWWGVAIGIPNTALMAFLAFRFDPRSYIRDPHQIAAHHELMSHILPDAKADA